MEFKIGDVVVLKSGSLLMTVNKVGKKFPHGGIANLIECKWYDQKANNFLTDWFKPETLDKNS